MSASETAAAEAGSARSGVMTALNKTMEAAAMKHAISEAALTKLSGRIDSIFLPGAFLEPGCAACGRRSSRHSSSSATYLGGSPRRRCFGGTFPAPRAADGHIPDV